VASFGEDLSFDSALLVFEHRKFDRWRANRREGGALAAYLYNRNVVRLYEITPKICVTEANVGAMEDPT
jgi:hypothetical protein